jgi:hypothetical protein
MNKIQLSAFLAVILLAACGSGAPIAGETPTPTAAEQAQPGYPPPPPTPVSSGEGVYPYPPSGAPIPYNPYPAHEGAGGNQVSWEEAQAIILEGQVEQIFQFHDLTVIMTLKDGTQIETIEPAIDEVLRIIDRCGDKCADISFATE